LNDSLSETHLINVVKTRFNQSLGGHLRSENVTSVLKHLTLFNWRIECKINLEGVIWALTFSTGTTLSTGNRV